MSKRLREELDKKWYEFCELGGLHCTEEAQVMMQDIENYHKEEWERLLEEVEVLIQKYHDVKYHNDAEKILKEVATLIKTNLEEV